MKYQILTTVICSLLFTGCASESAADHQAKIDTHTQGNVPAWILNPSSANGYAASNCVESSGNFSIDRNHAISLARNTLAQNMDNKVSVLEKNYQKMSNSAGVKVSGTSFEQISKQIASVSLKKSQVEQIALVNISGVDQTCALVVIPKTTSDEIFNTAVTSDSAIDPADKASLYKEFVSQKTAKALEAQAKTF